MTAVQERPAGRMARPACPAGARRRLPVVEEHGTLRGVRWHRMTKVATCPPCRRVAADQRAAQRKAAYLRRGGRLVDACGVRRRLRALAAIGWGVEALAAELDCHRSNVQKIRDRPRSTPETVAAVTELYDRLSMSPGPNPLAAAVARRRGWPPPLAWDDESIDDPSALPHSQGDRKENGVAFDEIAVQRAIHGERVHLRPPERAAAIRLLTARGRSAAEIAELLDTTKRSVTRHRTRNEPSRRTA